MRGDPDAHTLCSSPDVDLSDVVSDGLDLIAGVIRRHIAWAPVFAFVIAFLESLPFVGLFVPGTSLLLGLGAAAAMHGAPLWEILAAAALGATLGAWISYETGRAQCGRLNQNAFLLARPKILAAGQALFQRHGAASVAIGRFLPVMRPMVPMIAGAFGLQARRFHLVNIASVLLWSPAFILPGAAAGLTARSVGGGAAIILILAMAALVAALFLLRRLTRLVDRLAAHAGAMASRALARAPGAPVWRARLARLVLGPEHALVRWRSAGVCACILLIVYVLNLGADVVSQRPIVRADVAIANLLYGLRTPWLDALMMTASALGDGGQRTAATVLATLYLLYQRRWRWALALALVMTGAALATPAFKTVFHVARPSTLYSGAEAYSFPSGHATSAAAFYLSLAWMASRAFERRWRPLIWLPALAAILLTAVSRVYLGAHWPSDVIAGMALGGALASLAIALAASDAKPSADMPPWQDGVAFVTALFLVAGSLGPRAYNKAEDLYAPYLQLGPAPRGAANLTGAAIPARRIDLLGQPEEPFVALWRAQPGALEARLRAKGWRTAPRWSWRGGLAALDGRADLHRLPPPNVLHEGRPAMLTLVAPGASADDRRILRLWPSGRRSDVYVGSLTRETAVRPLRIVTLLREDDATALDDPLLSSIAPFEIAKPR